MTDLISRTRPTTERLASEWTPKPDFTQHLSSNPPGSAVPRRLLLVGAAAAAGVAGAFPVVVPGLMAPAAADPLQVAAAGAGAQRQLRWSPGQYLHVRTVVTQVDRSASGRHVRDDWYASDGWSWSRVTGTRVESRDPFTDLFIFPPTGAWESAPGLPTEAAELDRLLRATAQGSNSVDEAVLEAVGDLLRLEAASPELRAAAIGVLRLNRKLTVSSGTDPAGRAAVVVVFADPLLRPGVRRSLHLDPTTGEFRAESVAVAGDTYEAVVDRREIVTGLPPEIVVALGTEKVEKQAGVAPKTEPTRR